MSALKPSNGKYRNTWKIFGKQVVPSKPYLENHDKVKWGDLSSRLVKEELTSPSHYRIRFERE